MDELLDYMNGLNINSLGASLDGIVKSERLKNQKVEILDSWKANITQNFEYVVANVNTLKSTFINAWKIYNSIGKLNNDILLLQAKKTAIA